MQMHNWKPDFLPRLKFHISIHIVRNPSIATAITGNYWAPGRTPQLANWSNYRIDTSKIKRLPLSKIHLHWLILTRSTNSPVTLPSSNWNLPPLSASKVACAWVKAWTIWKKIQETTSIIWHYLLANLLHNPSHPATKVLEEEVSQ